MADYPYTRELVNGLYNINNINHTNGGAEPVPLRDEIKAEATLPDQFTIVCNGPVCTVTTAASLTGAQETTLSAIVANQKVDN